jgi:hypothetical protein
LTLISTRKPRAFGDKGLATNPLWLPPWDFELGKKDGSCVLASWADVTLQSVDARLVL